MLRLWLVNEYSGAAYPVTTDFAESVVTSDTGNEGYERMRAEVSENVGKAARQMAMDEMDGNSPPRLLINPNEFVRREG